MAYEVIFGRRGLTVEHVDASGRFTFLFDTAPESSAKAGVKETLIVNPMPLRNDKLWRPSSPDEQRRAATVLTRVQEWLVTHGYDVEIEKVS